jgi:hypothetical protein
MAVTIKNAVAGLTSNTSLLKTAAKVMVTGDIIFTAVGSVQILGIVSECVTPNDATTSRLLYSFVSAYGTTNLSASSVTLPNVNVGYTVAMANPTALGEAPLVSVSGVVMYSNTRGARVPSGSVRLVITNGSTTGTWRHFIKYEPLESGAYMVANQ